MKVFVFNPEHDIALAANLDHFTAPHAGRHLRHDLAFLPGLWAGKGDYVLVDDVGAAREALHRLGIATHASLIDDDSLADAIGRGRGSCEILPWGWDIALRGELKAHCVEISQMPSVPKLNIIRQMSHRGWAADHLLWKLREIEGTVGEAFALSSVTEVRCFLAKQGKVVLKAPWSSSGRGIRYVVDNEEVSSKEYNGITMQLEGWINNVIRKQGCIMAEPYYNKVCDFGMEFIARHGGKIEYRGLSVFHTKNGAYTGNVLEDEAHKEAFLSRYVSQRLLKKVRQRIIELSSEAFAEKYTGPFGVDMMIVRDDSGLALHPLVELNLRMTMGHVANVLAKREGMEGHTMRIIFSDGHYRLRIEPLPSAGNDIDGKR